MGVQLIGTGGAAADVDPTFDALRVSQRPPENVGAFRIGKQSGLMTAIAANGNVFVFRNPGPLPVILQFLKVRYAVITGFTAAQELGFNVLHARNWANATAGGTQISVAANNLKKRTALAASQIDARIAAAAVVTAPAAPVVLDTDPFMSSMAKTLAAGAAVQDAVFEDIFDATNGSDHPIVYAPNEGFTIQNSVLMGAAGTVRMAVTAAWLEANSY